ncbi:hypothetical protein NDU88_005949 [Pleurodeles waltl]|uniref:Uncharacterized protein n=1 Tax=Pleurodeles waltl TaxID=8319 RepID=A0AAV7UJL6_PLEWA|nr:hypothetical protein NDU88_005949 [Pleurodeles waltl]
MQVAALEQPAALYPCLETAAWSSCFVRCVLPCTLTPACNSCLHDVVSVVERSAEAEQSAERLGEGLNHVRPLFPPASQLRFGTGYSEIQNNKKTNRQPSASFFKQRSRNLEPRPLFT